MSSGQDIKAYREERGLSQRQLAKELGVSQQSISAIERGVKLPGAKSDAGKIKLSLVPPEAIIAIARIREYGKAKYQEAEDWTKVDPMRFHEALLRHALACWENPYAVDPESGLPSMWHLITNASFLCAFLEMKNGAEEA